MTTANTTSRPSRGLAVGLAVFIALWMLAAMLAFTADSCWLLSRRLDAARLADNEVRLQEERFVTVLSQFNNRRASVAAALAAYEKAGDISERHEAFRQLIASVGAMPGSGSANALQRRHIDEYAGALNRHRIATRYYSDAAMAYNSVALGLRGKLAHRIGDYPVSLPIN